MKKLLPSVFFTLIITGCLVGSAQAANNIAGVHILDPSEVEQAAKIVNGNNGDWGYVTVPIRANDRDLKKWQKFMDDAARLHVIPLLRIATVADGNYWRKPSFDEVLDFSNFLNDLRWPTKTKHVIIFNEPNHHSEWGGKVDALEYGAILDFAIDRFKYLDEDFFILPAGLDAAVPDSKTSASQYKFLARVFTSFPQIPAKIDGWNSHSYPNPAFSGRPGDVHKSSIRGYQHELAFLKRYTTKKIPVFITETGWQMESLSEEKVGEFYSQAFTSVWSDSRVMAVTPFLLNAHDGPFKQFSLLNSDGSFKEPARVISSIEKTKGGPEIEPDVPKELYMGMASKDIHPGTPPKLSLGQRLNQSFSALKKLWSEFRSRPHISINDHKIYVEIASTPEKRSKGLSNRKSLRMDSGMLFSFEKPGLHKFWMKDMHFPLDFLFIKDERISDIKKDVKPDSQTGTPEIVSPKSEVNYVLEVNSGIVEKYNIQIGDRVVMKI
jgi:uncharacterized membrane protein (UPF0127 family)